MDKLKALSEYRYREQAVLFMNSYWREIFQANEAHCEMVWLWKQGFVSVDQKAELGCALDFGEVRRLSGKLNENRLAERHVPEMDLTMDRTVSLLEYLVWRFKVPWQNLVQQSREAVDPHTEAQRLASKAAVDEARAKAEASMADKKDAEAARQEAKVAAAERKDAVNKVIEEERKYEEKKARLGQRSQDMSLGIVKRNKAANELAQLRAKPTLSLQRAKITLTAADKRAARLAKRADRAAAKATAAYEAAEKAFADAESQLRKLLSADTKATGRGTAWWLQREFEEAKRIALAHSHGQHQAHPGAGGGGAPARASGGGSSGLGSVALDVITYIKSGFSFGLGLACGCARHADRDHQARAAAGDRGMAPTVRSAASFSGCDKVLDVEQAGVAGVKTTSTEWTGGSRSSFGAEAESPMAGVVAAGSSKDDSEGVHHAGHPYREAADAL
mmetsp:Transcript_11898/g.22915  ORF Transcript_11898/g.22915 Transcript_11898/m.22915 type:complete len:447 (-) Transcript_11898:68-1408(-)